jgi:hypothetical protein
LYIYSFHFPTPRSSNTTFAHQCSLHFISYVLAISSSHLPVDRPIIGSTLIETSTPVMDYPRDKRVEQPLAVWDKIVVNPTRVVRLAPRVFRESSVLVEWNVQIMTLAAPAMLPAVRLVTSVIFVNWQCPPASNPFALSKLVVKIRPLSPLRSPPVHHRQ